MPEYVYRARTRSGGVTRGKVKAPSAERASTMLAEHGLLALDVTDIKELRFWRRDFSFRRVRARDRAVAARQIGTMVQAGIPILQALRIVVQQTENTKLAGILQSVSYDVEGGSSLSDALAQHSMVFSEFFVSMVRAGEASGKVASTLEALAEHEERDAAVMRKVRSAMVYPAFVVAALFALVIVMMVFVMPQLIEFFREANVPLPLLTRIMIGATNILIGYWWFFLLFLGVALYLVAGYLRTAEGQYNFSAFVLRLPVFNRVLRKLYLARFAGAMQTLLVADVPVVRALLIGRDVLTNLVYQRIIERVAEDVKNGSSIAQALERHPEVPLMVSAMVSVGERSGQLGASFGIVQKFFQRDVDDLLASLTTLLEPALIVAVGLAVGAVILGIMMPMYSLVRVIT